MEILLKDIQNGKRWICFYSEIKERDGIYVTYLSCASMDTGDIETFDQAEVRVDLEGMSALAAAGVPTDKDMIEVVPSAIKAIYRRG